MIQILRKPEVLRLVGIGKTSLDKSVQDGFFPKPVRLIGARAVGWPSDEVEAVIRHRIAGHSNDEMRELVKRLETRRGKK